MQLLNLIKRAIFKIVRVIRCAYFNRLIDEGGGQFDLPNPWMPVTIRKAPNARLVVRGCLRLDPWMGGEAKTIFDLAEGSSLEFAGDFEIGHGVKIVVGRRATLRFGGRCKESGSGITCDSTVLVHRRIDIGSDFICAWGVFITDCDWHEIVGNNFYEEVLIGDHVWIAHGASILKGAKIAAGSIVGCHAVVTNQTTPENSLVAGVPAKVTKTGVQWHRDHPL